MARSAQKGMWAGAFIAPWDWRARTVSTALLGSYRPTEQQERLLLPSTPQLRPQPSLSPIAQLQEQRGACVVKGNISSSGERIYHVPGQRSATTTRPKSTRAKGNAGSAPSKKPLLPVGGKRCSNAPLLKCRPQAPWQQ
jgi:hypothetical protein